MPSKPTRETNPRALALTVLDRVRESGAYSNLQLNQLLEKSALTAADRRLATNLVYGTLQHQLTLETWLFPLVSPKRLAPWVETLLLMTLYQYHYLDRVPDFAATNEAIELAKRRGNPGIRRLVTGVLHTAMRNGMPDYTKVKDPLRRLVLTASLPAWLVAQLIDQYGRETTEQIAKTINDPAHMSLRVNQAKTDLPTAVAALEAAGVTTHRSPLAEAGLVVRGGNALSSAPFKEGLVTIQDESAMLAVESMALRGDELVLDACAAPGGKTTQLAAALSSGRVVALDLHAHKVGLIKQNAARLGVADRVVARQLDARKLATEFADATFDRALVDAPCSGMGLLRRKPEIRYAKSLEDSRHLHEIQGAILDSVAPKVKKGGIITYSTCTILRQENDATVTAFLKRHPEYRLIKTRTARKVKDDRPSKTLTILPSDAGSDGFFISSLKRIH